MEVDISDYVGHYIYFGFPELAFQNFKNFIKEGDVILDIGANIGFTALNFAKLVGPTGTVYAFEPDPYNYLQLENNWRLNKLMNLKLINIGLGSTHQIVKLKTELEDNRGKNRVDFNATENFAEVSIVTIDDFVKNANIKFVHLIKIDVEGYEYEVLKGAKNVLKVYKPKLFVEIDEQNLTFHKSSPNEVVSFLLQIGYTTFKDAACGKDIYLDTDFSKCHFDLLVY
ncbi:MAG: FkbM family methyltransferase [Cytophagaceae bacterium]